jgi:hypothetical protein
MLGSFLKQGRRPKALPRRKFLPTLERIEDRTLPSVVIVGSVATITGTSGNDNFQIRMASPAVIDMSDNGGASFTPAPVNTITEIDVRGEGGLDVLTLDQSNGLIANAGNLAIHFNLDSGAGGKGTLMITGNPNATGLNETFNDVMTPFSGTLSYAESGGTSSTITLSNTARIVDTMNAAAINVNGPQGNTLFVLRDAPDFNGFHTNLIQAVDSRLLDDDPYEQSAETGQLSPSQEQGVSSGYNAFPDSANGELNAASVPLQFANKTQVTLNGASADVLFLLTATTGATGLSTVSINPSGQGQNVVATSLTPSVTLNVPSTNIYRADTNVHDIVIDELYALRLERTAATPELNYWEGIYNSSGEAAVVTGINQSREAFERMVIHLYEHYLGREPGQSEVQFWWGQLMNGSTEEQVMSGVLASNEFFNRAQAAQSTGDATNNFLQELYQTMLNRTAGNSELAYWDTQIGTLGRAGVVAQFAASDEYRNEMIDMFYSTMLSRPSASNQASKFAGKTLDQIRLAIQESSEFQANA